MNGFDALDPVMQCWTKVHGTVEMLMCLLDAAPNEGTVETARRHANDELVDMNRALQAAWESLVGEALP